MKKYIIIFTFFCSLYSQSEPSSFQHNDYYDQRIPINPAKTISEFTNKNDNSVEIKEKILPDGKRLLFQETHGTGISIINEYRSDATWELQLKGNSGKQVIISVRMVEDKNKDILLTGTFYDPEQSANIYIAKYDTSGTQL